MLYTAKIATGGPTDVSHTYHAASDALAIAEARRVEAETRDRMGSCGAVLERLIRWDGTPPTDVDLYQ